MPLDSRELLETLSMVHAQHLDIRTVTLGVDLRDCADPNPHACARKAADKVRRVAARLVPTAREIEAEYGIPIVNTRLSVTPVSWFGAACQPLDLLPVARALDQAAEELGLDFLGGFSALVEKEATVAARHLLDIIPDALAETRRLCASVNVGSTRAGLNMDAIGRMGRIIAECAARSADRHGADCARLVVFCNAVSDNPFMAGAFFGTGEGETGLSVGISGPGAVLAALRHLGPDRTLLDVAETIKRIAFKITRAGELIGRRVAERIGVPFNIVDLSLAPTPAPGDSIGDILEAMGLEKAGGPGSTAALALLNDAVKRGGAMATGRAGGLSGAFIPVCEDATLARRAAEGALTLEKLEALTAVCSVGLDMIVVPGDTPPETLAAIIADEAAIGLCHNKTTAVRIIPAPGKHPGERVDFGGLLGGGPVMAVSSVRADGFIRRGGRLPPPVGALRN